MANELIAETKPVKVFTNKLREGMYVARLDRPWLETPFIFQGFAIINQREIQELQKFCKYVYVDMFKTRLAVDDSGRLEEVKKVVWTDSVLLEDEIATAGAILSVVAENLSNIFERSKQSAKPNFRLLKPSIKACTESLLRNVGAWLWLGQCYEHDSELVGHSVRVALISMVVGRHLGLPRQQIETLGQCGLFHDIGRTLEDPTGELGQTRPSHPELGRDLLSHDPLVPQVVLETVYSHHERVDGKGYPKGELADTLSYYTSIISIADMYDKLVHQSKVSSNRARQMLYLERGKRFDVEIMGQFNMAIGPYPTGTIIELNTGEVGITLDADPNSRLRPRIAVLTDSKKQQTLQSIIILNLAEEKVDDLSIVRSIDGDAFKALSNAFFEQYKKVELADSSVSDSTP